MRSVKLVLPLEGVVDVAEELARLDKVLAKAEKDVAQLEKRLGNKNFVERAKPEIVESFQGKLVAARTLRDTLRASRDRLTGGAA